MKILYLHQYYNNPSMSGSTRSYEIARRMVEKGFDVNIITSNRNTEFEKNKKFTIEEGIKIHWINVNYSNHMSPFQRIFAFVKFAILAFLKAIKIKGDIVYASSTPLTISIPGILTSKILKIPFYFEVRDLWPEIPIAMGYLKNPISKKLALMLEKYSYNNSKGIIALSEGMKYGISKTGYPENKIIVIPNGSDISLFDHFKKNKNVLKKKFGFSEKDILIVYPGTFGVVNNLSYVVKLANKFKNESNIKFVLVGDGKEKKKIIKESENLNILGKNIHIFDQIPKKSIPDLFCMADAIISTILPIEELENNSANKFFDALASGTCLIINHKGWQEDEIKKYNCGIKISENIDEAYQELKPILENKKTLDFMGLNGRKIAEKKYSRDLLTEKLINFIKT